MIECHYAQALASSSSELGRKLAVLPEPDTTAVILKPCNATSYGCGLAGSDRCPAIAGLCGVVVLHQLDDMRVESTAHVVKQTIHVRLSV